MCIRDGCLACGDIRPTDWLHYRKKHHRKKNYAQRRPTSPGSPTVPNRSLLIQHERLGIPQNISHIRRTPMTIRMQSATWAAASNRATYRSTTLLIRWPVPSGVVNCLPGGVTSASKVILRGGHAVIPTHCSAALRANSNRWRRPE